MELVLILDFLDCAASGDFLSFKFDPFFAELAPDLIDFFGLLLVVFVDEFAYPEFEAFPMDEF